VTRRTIGRPGAPWLLVVALAGGCDGTPGAGIVDAATPPADAGGGRLVLPEPGQLYHGVFPGHEGGEGEEDDITAADVASYEETVGRTVAWVYFSHNWYAGRAFPLATAKWIRERGAVPFIRLMLRSSPEQDIAEPLFTLEAIAGGAFDADLTAWGQAAAGFGTPLLVEWGTEVNGSWFSWNGVWNGGAEVGPGRFREAYRHIVATIRAAGAANITWAFHMDAQDVPDERWNAFERYYPGDDVVDWVGISAYGALEPTDTEWPTFREKMDATVPRVTAMAPGKPVFVFELGVTLGAPGGDAAAWADATLTDLLAGRWPAVRGFSWWNERWENDDDPRHDSDLRVQDVPGLREVMRRHLRSDRIVDRPILR